MFAQSYSGIFDHRLKCEHSASGICKIYAICLISWWRCFKINHRQRHFIIYIFNVHSQFKSCVAIFFLSTPFNEMQTLQVINWCPRFVLYIIVQVKFFFSKTTDDTIRWHSAWQVKDDRLILYLLVNEMVRCYLDVAPLWDMNLSSTLLQLNPKDWRHWLLPVIWGRTSRHHLQQQALLPLTPRLCSAKKRHCLLWASRAPGEAKLRNS